MNLVEAFWAEVDQTEECWNWTGYISTDGYGYFSHPDSHGSWGAHRISYIIANGELTPGMVIDHLCRNRSCVRPEHLEEITHRENVRRGQAAVPHTRHMTLRCAWGHSLDEHGLCQKCVKYSETGSWHG